jgi:hypothetical protein
MAHESYSDLTPGSAWNMSCLKEMWSFDIYRDTQFDFASCLNVAKYCAYFEFNKELKNAF